MNEQFQQLVNYVQQCLAQGYSEESIRSMLNQHNWDASLVDQAFAYLQNSAPVAAPPVPQAPTESPVPQKYRLFSAIADTFRAIRHNGATFGLTVLISYAATLLLFTIVDRILQKTLYGPLGLLFASTGKRLTVLLVNLIVYTICYALAYAFIITSTSLAVNDGADHHKSNLGSVLKLSLTRFRRVAIANTMVSLVTFWPAVLIIFLPLILITGTADIGFVFIVVASVLFAFAWAIIATVRYGLAPYIALFEPAIAVKHTLKHSQHLLEKGGQWFIIKGILLIAVILTLVAVITRQNVNDLSSSDSIVSNLLIIVISIVANGTYVLLCRNRTAVRTNRV